MFYLLFLVVTALEMLFELRISMRNSGDLIRKGAIEIGHSILPVMIMMYIVMYIGSAIEFVLSPPQLPFWWIILFLIVFALAKGLKFWAVSTLGEYWTMKLLIVPESKVVTGGPYRWIRHPNYIAVLLEIAATTLLGKSFVTFGVVFFSFLIVLWHRIKLEEEGLIAHTDYAAGMTSKHRFIP